MFFERILPNFCLKLISQDFFESLQFYLNYSFIEHVGGSQTTNCIKDLWKFLLFNIFNKKFTAEIAFLEIHGRPHPVSVLSITIPRPAYA